MYSDLYRENLTNGIQSTEDGMLHKMIALDASDDEMLAIRIFIDAELPSVAVMDKEDVGPSDLESECRVALEAIIE